MITWNDNLYHVTAVIVARLSDSSWPLFNTGPPTSLMKNKEVAQSPLAAEEWQLRILWEMHKKQPRPTAEQRRLLATQTGLDAKWITRWFKRANSPSKSKARSMVGRPHSRSPTTVVTAAKPTKKKSTDGSNPVKPPNSAEPIVASGTSPSLFGDSLGHTFLFPGSDGVAPESGRSGSAATLELEYPDASPNLQANREHTIFYPHPQGANPALPQPHPDLVKHSQQTLEILTSPVFLASPFKNGTSSPSTSMDVPSVKSYGPHTSPSPGPLQTRYAHLNYVSESLAPAYSTEFGHPQRNLGPALAEAETAASTHVDAGFSVPDLVSPQLGPSSDPHLSMYWLLFDKDHDSSVDGQRDDGSRPSSRPLLGNDRMNPQHVTPTPVSFLAKWEDMLALERLIRSASHGAKLVQSGEAQKTDCAVEANRTKQGSGREVTLTRTESRCMAKTDRVSCGPDRDCCKDEQQPDEFSVGHF